MILLSETKLVEIFCNCDDFCKKFDSLLEKRLIAVRSSKSHNQPGLSYSEIMTILIVYHLSGEKCFQYYYEKNLESAQSVLRSYFPRACSYNRFVELIPRVLFHLWIFVSTSRTGTLRGQYYIDSKKLPVCDNLRIYSNRVFKHIAGRGKSSTGWFYGLKLFLIINPVGEIIRVMLTPANVADNNASLLKKIFVGLKGKVYGDKGFLTKFMQYFLGNGLKIVTKVKRNMKNKLMELEEKFYLSKRGVIESIFDILMTVCDIDHTRHRSPVNAIVHVFGGLAAYSYLDRLPSVYRKRMIRCKI